jgi:hypothetical protein
MGNAKVQLLACRACAARLSECPIDEGRGIVVPHAVYDVGDRAGVEGGHALFAMPEDAILLCTAGRRPGAN